MGAGASGEATDRPYRAFLTERKPDQLRWGLQWEKSMGQPNLDELVARARAYKMNPAERREQRVSMVMGLRGHSSTLTREKVETLLDEFEGSHS